MSRTRIDNMVAERIRLELTSRGLMQKDVAATADMTQPQLSRMLSFSGPSIRADQLERVCSALGLDARDVLSEATLRAAEFTSEPQTRKGTDRDQIDALGRQLAEMVWNNCDDWEFVNFALDHTMDREDKQFWEPRKKQLALMVALSELAYVIALRYPVRDGFLLKPRMEPHEIIR